jgi:putative hydroxymethylpyrimidine transport system substrate-binding protein
VKLYVPPDPEATIQLVAAGQDDFGISYMTDVIMAREQGVKVVSLAAIVQHPLNCIMTLKSSGIDSPGKLKGATIGTTGEPSDQAFLNWVLEHNGVNPRTVRLVNIGFNLAPALRSRKVDAIIGAYWPWEGIKLQEEGSPVNVMKLQDSGVPDYYELILT